jgi:UDP-glucuronate 4-epimerase
LGEDQGHLVLASSSSVYGSGPPDWDGPLSEDLAADRPLSVYAGTKRACELLAHAYSRLASLRATCLRFFTVVGPRARPDLTPFLFADAVWRGEAIRKFGDGTSARDYTYVGDTVQGVLAALDRFELAAAGQVQPGDAYECINLGNDRPVPLNDYLALLERLLGKRAAIRQLPDQPMDPHRTWADLTKARRLLGYEPTTSFEAALTECVHWYLREVAGPQPEA